MGCGGAFIYDLKTSLTLESHPLPKKETIKLIRLCRERDILLVLENMDYSEYEKFVEEKESRDRAAKFNNRKVDDLMKVLDAGPIKAVIVGEPDDVGAALEDIESRNLQFNIAMSRAHLRRYFGGWSEQRFRP